MEKIKQIFTPTSQEDIELRYGKAADSTEGDTATSSAAGSSTTSRGYTTSTFDPSSSSRPMTKTTARGYQAEHSASDDLPGTTARGFSTNNDPASSRPISSSPAVPTSSSTVHPTSSSPGYSYPVEPSQPKPSSGGNSGLERDVVTGRGAMYGNDGPAPMYDYRSGGGGLPHIPGEYPLTPGDELAGGPFGDTVGSPMGAGTSTTGTAISSGPGLSDVTNRGPATTLPATTPTTASRAAGPQDFGSSSTGTPQFTAGQPTTQSDSHYGRDAGIGAGVAAGTGLAGYGAYEATRRDDSNLPIAQSMAQRSAVPAAQPQSTSTTTTTTTSTTGPITTTTTTPIQSRPVEAGAPTTAADNDTHYGRNAALGTAGVAGVGAAGYGGYEALRSDQEARPTVDPTTSPSTVGTQQPQQTFGTADHPDSQKQIEKDRKDREKELEKHRKEEEKHEKERQKDLEKHRKEQEKREKESQKQLEKEREKREKELEKEREKREKERLAAQKEQNNNYGRDAAIAGGTAGAAGVAGAGAYEATQDSGPASKTIGPHESNAANVLDPRVKPDPELQKSSEPTTAAPYKSDMTNRAADPSVDSPRTEPTSSSPVMTRDSHGQELLSEDNRVSVDDKGHAHLHKKKFDEHGEKKKEGFFSKLLHRNKDKDGKDVDESSYESSKGRTSAAESGEPRSPVTAAGSSSQARTSGGAMEGSGIPIGEDGMITIHQQGSHPDAPHLVIREKPGGGLETVPQQ